MLKRLLPLAAGALLMLNAAQVWAQDPSYQGIPIAYWDFEKSTNRSLLDTSVRQQINSGNVFRGKFGGGNQALTRQAGAGATSWYGGIAGSGVQATYWSNVTSDPKTSASTYFEFKINTIGFTGITFGFDYAVGNSSYYPYVGVNYSPDGGANWKNLGSLVIDDPGYWQPIISATLDADADNKPDVRIRIYGWYGANNANSWFRLDNAVVFATGMTANAGTKTTLNEKAIYTSYTSGGGINNGQWARYGIFNIPTGATLNLGDQLDLGYGSDIGGVSVQNGGTLDCGSLLSNHLTGANSSFNLQAGATLIVRSNEGIAVSGSSGNIRTTTRNFNASANYIYRKSPADGAQVTGTGLPANLTGSLTIDNTAGVSLTNNTSITGTLNLTNGIFSNGSNLTLSNAQLNRNTGSLNAAPTFSGSNYNVNYTGSTTVTAGYELPGSTSTLNNLTVNKTGGVNLNQDVTVNGTLNLTQGALALGNYNLIANGALTGGSANAYVKTNGTGALKRNVGATAVTFPVGVNSYNPATLTNAGTADNFSVRVSEGVYEDGYSGTPVNSATTFVVNRTWHVSEETPGGSDVTLQLQWNNGEVNNSSFSNSHVYVAHHNNDEWESLYPDDVAGAPAAVGSGPYTTEQSGISSFSPFIVGSGAAPSPLPVALTGISARNEGSSNRIEWQSGKEASVSHYEIEKSRDGKSFNYLSKTEAMNQPFGYITYDDAPFEGLTYYRLKMIDKDGSFAYSKVVSAFMKGKHGFAMSAFPNPAATTVRVKVAGGVEGAQLQLTDLSGRVIARQEVVGGEAQFDVRSLASGVYFIKYADGQRTETIKVNKQ